jgi:hypothetical protein
LIIKYYKPLINVKEFLNKNCFTLKDLLEDIEKEMYSDQFPKFNFLKKFPFILNIFQTGQESIPVKISKNTISQTLQI